MRKRNHQTASSSLCLRALVTASAVSLGFTILVGTSLGQEATAASAPRAADGTQALQDVPANVDAVAMRSFPNAYGGLIVTRGGTHMDVYLTKLAPQVERSLSAAAPAGTITFVPTPSTLQFLDSLQQTILHSAAVLNSAGVNLIEWGPDVGTGRELVGVEGLTRAGSASLDHRFGARNLELFDLTPAEVPVPTAGRANDSSPWKAGDYISNSSHSSGCSSGFGIFFGAGSVQGNLTAAHCFSAGQRVYNYAATEGHGSNRLMGFISNRDQHSRSTDAEILDTSFHGGSSGSVWTGSPTSTTRKTVSGSATNPDGDAICNSGAYSGEVCGATIRNNNLCLKIDGVYRCHIVHAVSSSHAIANETGDSGGPVFRFIHSRLYAVGIVSASSGADERSCRYNRNQLCFWDIFYSSIGAVLSEYDAHLIT